MKIIDIKIGSRFRKDLGDIQTLADSIQEKGLLQPIVVNQNNELIAGQRRLEAHRLLGWTDIPVHVINLDDIIKGEFHENAVRKGFSISERVAILEEVERQRIGHRTGGGTESEIETGNGKGGNLPPFSEENRGKKSRDIVAQYTGVSPRQLQKEKKIVDAAHKYTDYETPKHMPGTPGPKPLIGPKTVLERVENGKMSVHDGFRQVSKFEWRQEYLQGLRNAKPVIDLAAKNIQLYNNDYRSAAVAAKIPDNSVPLIATDPPYEKEYLHLYRDLGTFAYRVLKPGGSLVVYCHLFYLPTILDSIRDSGLTYNWVDSINYNGLGRKPVYERGVLSGWKPVLWFIKGDKIAEGLSLVPDVIHKKNRLDKRPHDWAQDPEEAEFFISYLTLEGQLVLDPMMGSGTTGKAAFKLKRKYIGIEIDPKTFENTEADLASNL